MHWIDWLVLVSTLLLIVCYGIYKSRNTRNIDSFLLADKQLPWYNVGLSVMATQASAITFLSAPGQAYSDGLRFVQFYFGLPLAMIVLCISFIPIFHKLNVYTAYEYLEKRFDAKTRLLTAFLFLVQRGISTGITIYAPSIVLSTILSINIIYTTVIIGGLVILYTVYGGTKAVSYTQMLQMSIIFAGLFFAAYMVVHLMPGNIGLLDSLHIAGKMGRLNALDSNFDWDNRYNLWSGLIGGFFLQLSYFGTDQSQVGRYLTGKSISESRLGLIMNAMVKIPMQFFILLIGALVFSFYQFYTPPLFFNQTEVNSIKNSAYKTEYQQLESSFNSIHEKKQEKISEMLQAIHANDETKVASLQQDINQTSEEADKVRDKGIGILKKNNALADTNDTNYVFLSFVMKYLPVGLTGLLIAIIFLASMGSTASGLSSLASTTFIDFYKRFSSAENSKEKELQVSRIATAAWGFFCLFIAIYAGKLGNLIEAVNILGSLFYGTILGIFLVAFYVKKVKGTSVFWAAIITEIIVFIFWLINLTAFLWLNLTGCALVVIIAYLLQILSEQTSTKKIS